MPEELLMGLSSSKPLYILLTDTLHNYKWKLSKYLFLLACSHLLSHPFPFDTNYERQPG